MGVTPFFFFFVCYFLIFYAILRAVPSKVRRLLLILLSIVVLVLLLVARKNLSLTPKRNFFTSRFLVLCILLRVLRRKPVEEPFLTVSRLLSLTYFRVFFIMILV